MLVLFTNTHCQCFSEVFTELVVAAWFSTKRPSAEQVSLSGALASFPSA